MKYILEAVEFGKYLVFPEDKKNITKRERDLIEKWVSKYAADKLYKDDGYYYYAQYGKVSPHRCEKISEIPQIIVNSLQDLKYVKKYDEEFIQYLIDKGMFTTETIKYIPNQSDEFLETYINRFVNKEPKVFSYIKNPSREHITRAIKINPNIIKYCDKDLLTDDLIQMAGIGDYNVEDSYYVTRAKLYGEKLSKSEIEELNKYLDEWVVSRVRKSQGLYYFINSSRTNYTPRGFENLKDLRFDVLKNIENDIKHLNKIDDKDFIDYLDKRGWFGGEYRILELLRIVPYRLKTKEFCGFIVERCVEKYPKSLFYLPADYLYYDMAVDLNPNTICYFRLTHNQDGLVGISEEKLRKIVRKALSDKRFDFELLAKVHPAGIFDYIDEDLAIKNFDKCPELIKSISEENQTEEMGEKAILILHPEYLKYIKKITEDVLIKYAHAFTYTPYYLELSDNLKTPKFNLQVVRESRKNKFERGSIFDLPKEYLSSNDYIIALGSKLKESTDKLVDFFSKVPQKNKRDVLEFIFHNKHSLLYHLRINVENKEDFKWLVNKYPDSLKYVRRNDWYGSFKSTIKPIKENFSEEEEGDILYIFDFDDTLVKTPRFEDLAIPLLEKVTIEDMLKISCDHIGVSIGDLKHDNGRIYVDDPDEKIDIKGNWVRKKKRVYLLAPYTFHLSDDSFPTKLKKMSKLYKEVENKAIVTGRPSKIKSKVVKSLLDLGLELPRFGVHCYPLDDDNSDRVATWKAKKIIQLIKKTEIYNVKFYDDNRKWLRKVKEIVSETLPHVNLETIRVY